MLVYYMVFHNLMRPITQYPCPPQYKKYFCITVHSVVQLCINLLVLNVCHLSSHTAQFIWLHQVLWLCVLEILLHSNA